MEHLIKDQVDLTIEAIERKSSKTRSISCDDLLFAEPLVASIWSVITKSPMNIDQNKKLSQDIFDFAQEFVSPLSSSGSSTQQSLVLLFINHWFVTPI